MAKRFVSFFDESNILSSAFLERMNALLASGEVPGLFEGDEYTSLINACREAERKGGSISDTNEDLYKHFCQASTAQLARCIYNEPFNTRFP